MLLDGLYLHITAVVRCPPPPLLPFLLSFLSSSSSWVVLLFVVLLVVILRKGHVIRKEAFLRFLLLLLPFSGKMKKSFLPPSRGLGLLANQPFFFLPLPSYFLLSSFPILFSRSHYHPILAFFGPHGAPLLLSFIMESRKRKAATERREGPAPISHRWLSGK